MLEEPNIEGKKLDDTLHATFQLIRCSDGQSKLSLASTMMTIKTEDNLSESCMDKWAGLFHEYLPDDNLSASTYS